MSKRTWFFASLCVGLFIAPGAFATDVETLQREMYDLRKTYEARIDALEKRLADVRKAQDETKARLDNQPPPTPVSPSQSVSFNPNISVVLDGAYYTDDVGGEGSERANEAFRASHAGGHGLEEEEHGHGVFERGSAVQRDAAVHLAADDRRNPAGKRQPVRCQGKNGGPHQAGPLLISSMEK